MSYIVGNFLIQKIRFIHEDDICYALFSIKNIETNEICKESCNWPEVKDFLEEKNLTLVFT